MKDESLVGKFRAQVVDVNDPNRQGRIKVSCPRVLGSSVSAWCLPCIPNALDDVGDYFLPKVGESVWVEFEEGDINKPIWTGGWYSPNKIPISSRERLDQKRVIAYNGNTITMSDGEITIERPDGSCISLTNEKGVVISADNADLALTAETIPILNYLIDNAYSFLKG